MSHPPTPFHAFTIKYNGRTNRIVTEVTIFPAFDLTAPDAEAPAGHTTSGLWDTGATMSLITPQVVNRLKLSPVGTATLSHVAGSGICNTYMINLRLPNGVLVGGVVAAEGVLGNDAEAIIGMDVINQSDFAITNVDGQSRMSFRHPSLAIIDYVADANQINFAGAKRNAPCPCGKKDKNGNSVKYKDCHWPIVRQQAK